MLSGVETRSYKGVSIVCTPFPQIWSSDHNGVSRGKCVFMSLLSVYYKADSPLSSHYLSLEKKTRWCLPSQCCLRSRQLVNSCSQSAKLENWNVGILYSKFQLKCFIFQSAFLLCTPLQSEKEENKLFVMAPMFNQ